jgi:two-component system LytT family sensor kinase
VATHPSVPGTPAADPAARGLVAAAIGGAALLLALIESTRNYVGNQFGGYPMPWLAIFATSAPFWGLMALLTPWPIAVARLVPFNRTRLARTLGLHTAAALMFAVTHTTAMALYMVVTRETGFGWLFMKFSASLGITMMVYAAIVGAAHAFRFYREARARELAASQLQASLTEARLAVLRGQINPHFLFNTLNAISTMALTGEHDNVVRTLGCLAELLRTSLDDTLTPEVPLRNELAFLERYVDIQKIRLGDRLTVEYDIAPATLDAMVPSMILQPLVENAVTHGVATVPGPGRIRIHASRDDETLHVDITDSGPGVGATHDGSVPAPGRGAGIGLANTRARLVQLYGAHHSFTMGTAGGAGGQVTLNIPYRRGSYPTQQAPA